MTSHNLKSRPASLQSLERQIEELLRKLETAKARVRDLEQQISALDLAEADFIEDGGTPAPEPEFVEITEGDERHLERSGNAA